MRIFISIPWFSPAFKAGGPIRSIANLIENFNGDAKYSIFCSNKDLDGTAIQAVSVDKWTLFNAQTEVYYCAEEKPQSTMRRELKKQRPDVLFIIGIYSFAFNIYPLLFCKEPRKILSVRGMLHPGALSQKKLKKRVFLSLLKVSGVTKKVIFHATDEQEAQFVRDEFGGSANIVIAGNYGRKFLPAAPIEKKVGSLKLITIALISPMKNHLLVLQALQKVTGDVQYHIYGPVKDREYWEACLSCIHEMPKNVSVQYHGEVPPGEIENKLAAGHIFIMPSKSENFGHSIFEALSAGKPVITGHTTPWNELSRFNAGQNVNPEIEELVAAINAYVEMNQDEYDSTSRSASEYVKSHPISKDLDGAYRKLFFS